MFIRTLTGWLWVFLGFVFIPGMLVAQELPSGNPSDFGIKPELLDDLTGHIKNAPEKNIHSILLLKNGSLVYEEYFSGEDENMGQSLGLVEFDENTLHDLRSVSKSVTSILLGAAIDRGFIPSVDSKVVDLLPGYRESAASHNLNLTLRHLVTMSAGLEWNEDIPYTDPRNSELQLVAAKDPVAFMLGLASTTMPGEKFLYNGGLTVLLGAIIEKRVGMPLESWAKQVLFEPLGITDYFWHKHDSGLLWTASGLRLPPRSMAKIGLLMLNQGNWKGQQIVSRQWVAESLSPQVKAHGGFAGYGYQWWIFNYGWNEESHNIPIAMGNGGERIFVLAELDTVVVITAGNYNDFRRSAISDEIFANYILPALGVQNIYKRYLKRSE